MKRELVKRIDMSIHVQELCAKHDVLVRYQSLSEEVPRYYANQKNRTICIRPTKNTGYYVSALHELGHLLGVNQSAENDTLEREIGAWKYAMVNALVWTDTATRVMKKALMSYGVTNSQWVGVWNDCLSYYNEDSKDARVINKEEVA
mgnify:CR=1 FL=1